MVTRDATASVIVDMPKRRDEVVERALPDELILYNVAKDQVFLLNQTSAAIWDLCDGQRSIDGIAGEIAGHFAASPGVVREHVQRTIASFQERALLA